MTPLPETLRSIVAQVAADHGITARDIMGHDRSRHIARPRQEAYRRARAETGLSYPALAKFFDRDHATIIYGVRAAEGRLN